MISGGIFPSQFGEHRSTVSGGQGRRDAPSDGHGIAAQKGRQYTLYLNLADAHARLGHQASARIAVQHAAEHLAALPAGGYREFVAMGIDRLTRRLETAQDSNEVI